MLSIGICLESQIQSECCQFASARRKIPTLLRRPSCVLISAYLRRGSCTQPRWLWFAPSWNCSQTVNKKSASHSVCQTLAMQTGLWTATLCWRQALIWSKGIKSRNWFLWEHLQCASPNMQMYCDKSYEIALQSSSEETFNDFEQLSSHRVHKAHHWLSHFEEINLCKSLIAVWHKDGTGYLQHVCREICSMKCRMTSTSCRIC